MKVVKLRNKHAQKHEYVLLKDKIRDSLQEQFDMSQETKNRIDKERVIELQLVIKN